jgi:hypothetical protein
LEKVRTRRVKHAEWVAEATALFGDDPRRWRFVCPSCEHACSVQDWKDAGAAEGQVAFSCIGRNTGSAARLFEKPGPCDYAGGGLFGLNPVIVVMEDGKERPTFEFERGAPAVGRAEKKAVDDHFERDEHPERNRDSDPEWGRG